MHTHDLILCLPLFAVSPVLASALTRELRHELQLRRDGLQGLRGHRRADWQLHRARGHQLDPGEGLFAGGERGHARGAEAGRRCQHLWQDLSHATVQT